jgi:hypothetical protein
MHKKSEGTVICLSYIRGASKHHETDKQQFPRLYDKHINMGESCYYPCLN